MRKDISQQSLIEYGTLSVRDLDQVNKCRGVYNRLGFAYQLIFIKLFHSLPQAKPFEVVEKVLLYAVFQLEIDIAEIKIYGNNRTKISDHQQEITKYLDLKLYNITTQTQLKQFIFNESLRLEAHSLLKIQAISFLRANNVLLSEEYIINRLISFERKKARKHIFESIQAKLSISMLLKLNDLLVIERGYSGLEFLKRPAQKASSEAIIDLSERLRMIRNTAVLNVDLSSINNNYQKIFAREIRIYSVDRIRALEPSHRIAALVCFLHQAYQDLTDFLIDTYIKLLNQSINRATTKVNKLIQQKEEDIRQSLKDYQKLKNTISDITIPDIELRNVIFKKFPNVFDNEKQLDIILKSKSVQIFHVITNKFSYFRQFSPYVIANLRFESQHSSDVIEAINVLKELNLNNKRKLDINTPINFIPKKLRKHIINNNQIDRHAWECALLLKIRDEIRNNNISVRYSKRFCKFQDFFIPQEQWIDIRKEFFTKTKLPQNSQEAVLHLTKRLGIAYDQYIENAKYNKYSKIVGSKWVLSTDIAHKLSEKQEEDLKLLKDWIASHMRKIKLPDLLVEIDNELQFSEAFMLPTKQKQCIADDICSIIITIMAHGCNIGPHAMSQLVNGTSYQQIKDITDWQLTDDAQRIVLTRIVNAISCLGISKHWGEGKTSSSDAHLVSFHEKVLQQGYSLRFGDFALAFYTFVADNYAPLHSQPIECNEGEAPYALDGIINNESDLIIEEHYTDTRAASCVIFTAFEFLGLKFNPRIKGIQNHRLFKIDRNKDYGVLSPLLTHKESNIRMPIMALQWDRMAHFYASIFSGHITASVALKRLLALGPKNEFYNANMQLGRILKTENTLQNMIDPEKRKKKHRGLLKGEEMHQLARNISYGNRGIITARDLTAQRNCCNCLTLIMACIVYWQSKEIARIINEYHAESQKLDLSLLQHISPIGWDNIILYGEYIVNKDLIKR
jgi:TnpA family transposase